MIRLIIALIALSLAMAGITYYNHYYPPNALKHATQDALDGFASAMATKDRAKISDALKSMITDAAKIHLEVTVLSFSQGNSKPEVQDFDKTTFITFVDNILYSITDYSFHGQLQDFKISGDRKSADVSFIADAWGEGNSYIDGNAVNMRSMTNTLCEGKVVFDNKRVLIDTLDCRMRLRSTPKAGQESKLRSPEAIRQLLK